MGARANLAHMLLQACLKLIGNCHAECKIYQHHKAIIIKTCVPNSRPKLSPSSSKQAKNERERPKLLQLGPEAVLSVNLFFLRNLSMTERSTCKAQWKRSVGGLRKNTKTNKSEALLEPCWICSKNDDLPHVHPAGTALELALVHYKTNGCSGPFGLIVA